MTTSISTNSANNNNEQQRLYMPNLGSYKACGFILGFLVGLFIYLSTLGAEFVAVMVWGKDIILLASATNHHHDLIWFSLGWNFATTLIAVIILTCLRIMVVSVLSPSLTAYSGRTLNNINSISMELLGYLEIRFAIGALVGICVSWNITNCILGMRPPMIQSCIILAVACLWCRLTILCLQGGGSSSRQQQQQPLIYSTRMTSKTVTIGTGSNDDGDDDDADKSKPLLVTV